ncbi:MAG: hypothetical protein MUF34_37140 [Polyangiaceae bacterium]|jgi:hypothetical protein|nr:hypothetical protein [Polyangiaceae bacterium]
MLEDTVLLPTFRDAVGHRADRELREPFEGKGRELFGENGFQGDAAKAARLEAAFGLGVPARFTTP